MARLFKMLRVHVALEVVEASVAERADTLPDPVVSLSQSPLGG